MVANAMIPQFRAWQRYTLNGSPGLERHLHSICRQVKAGVEALIPAGQLRGLLLGGGYGRGEGGVRRTAWGDRPYNDLEFYVFVGGPGALAEPRYGAGLDRLGQQLSPAAGMEVEFKVLTPDQLRKAPVSMFFYDLVSGHQRLVGDDSLLLGGEHHGVAGAIPLHEATRLLMNRCAGLLFSAERLQREYFGEEDADFVGRNLAKLELALGDVVLVVAGQYHWSCCERFRRLPQLGRFLEEPWFGRVCRRHAAGVAFKLHPFCSQATRESLAERHAKLSALARHVWMWLENRRLGARFSLPADYALSGVNKCPETSALRNRLIHARTFGPAAILHPGAGRSPRERLLNSLSLLLWENRLPADRRIRRRLWRDLRTRATDFTGRVAAFEQLWRCFN